jgi:hypothetical protein
LKKGKEHTKRQTLKEPSEVIVTTATGNTPNKVE